MVSNSQIDSRGATRLYSRLKNNEWRTMVEERTISRQIDDRRQKEAALRGLPQTANANTQLRQLYAQIDAKSNLKPPTLSSRQPLCPQILNTVT